jgi:hypothetical protein
VTVGGAVQVEQLHEVRLILLGADALEFEEAAEVDFAAVRDVDEVALHQGFGR